MLLLQSVEETHSATAASPQEVKATYGGQKCLLSSGLQGAGRLHCLTQQDRGMPADSLVALTWSRLLAAVHAWSSSSSTQQAAPSHHSLHANLHSCSPRLRRLNHATGFGGKAGKNTPVQGTSGMGALQEALPCS